MTDVYLNNKFVGTVENASEFVQKIVDDRRKGIVDNNVNVLYSERDDQVLIENSRGRVRRPLIVIKDGKSLLTEKHVQQLEKNEISWSDLVKQGIIEYLDPLEEENAHIAFFEKDLAREHTHLEISPITMFGLISSLVPFANHTPSARINMGSKHQKQGIGLYATNFLVRMDMDVNLLHYPQFPVVKTIMHDLIDYSKHPSGQNVIIAVMSYKGYNMEDALIMNKGSIDRGLGRSTYFRPSITEELRYAGGLTDSLCVPDKETKGYRSEHDYRLLEEDGIIYPEAKIAEGDVIIGKTGPPRFLSGAEEYSLASNVRRESSLSVPHGEEGVVDFVIVTESEEGNRLVQVRVRDQRIPEIGDKFTSRHGQKGVIGIVLEQSDMPFTASGITPDIIFSPHGIPSRQTVSHLIELIAGKVGALAGRYVDGTTFSSETEADLRKELNKLGFRENGVETMYNGETGEQMTARIFVGNMYYIKLKYMVANKIQSRARGPIQLLTRQPTEGRAKEGGMRLGEMEKDTFVAHGASLLLKERFDADKTVIPVCESCGMIAIRNEYKKKSFCPVCGDSEISNIEIAYAFKLLVDELKALCIYPKLLLRTKY
jgi:DNA-directed RNA polymerase subunit B'